ncbi:MAG: hypothetical protein LUH04_00670 [Clostridium sp.]|nr:hypothetical protein [Clostridium sp.]
MKKNNRLPSGWWESSLSFYPAFPAGACTYPASQCLYEVRNEFLNLSDFK